LIYKKERASAHYNIDNNGNHEAFRNRDNYERYNNRDSYPEPFVLCNLTHNTTDASQNMLPVGS
jgi:hypothetical protein